ncbi:hypothetical protein HK405_015901, partial [Cladochytrium tenue]
LASVSAAAQSNLSMTQSMLSVVLDAQRNDLIVMDLRANLATLAVSLAALIAGLFGMNLPNFLETAATDDDTDHEGAQVQKQQQERPSPAPFYAVSGSAVAIGALVFALTSRRLGVLVSRRHQLALRSVHWPRHGVPPPPGEGPGLGPRGPGLGAGQASRHGALCRAFVTPPQWPASVSLPPPRLKTSASPPLPAAARNAHAGYVAAVAVAAFAAAAYATDATLFFFFPANTAVVTADPASLQVSLSATDQHSATFTAASLPASSSVGNLDMLLQDLRSRLSLDHATSDSAENMPPPAPLPLQALRAPPPSTAAAATAATAASSSYAGFYPTTSSSSGSVSAYSSSRSLPRPSRTSFDDDEDMNLS